MVIMDDQMYTPVTTNLFNLVNGFKCPVIVVWDWVLGHENYGH